VRRKLFTGPIGQPVTLSTTRRPKSAFPGERPLKLSLNKYSPQPKHDVTVEITRVLRATKREEQQS